MRSKWLHVNYPETWLHPSHHLWDSISLESLEMYGWKSTILFGPLFWIPLYDPVFLNDLFSQSVFIDCCMPIFTHVVDVQALLWKHDCQRSNYWDTGRFFCGEDYGDTEICWLRIIKSFQALHTIQLDKSDEETKVQETWQESLYIHNADFNSIQVCRWKACYCSCFFKRMQFWNSSDFNNVFYFYFGCFNAIWMVWHSRHSVSR